MGTQVIAGFLKDSVRSVSREPPGCCYSPARIELATRAVLGLEREKFPDLAAKVESALMNEKRRVHSQFEIPLVLAQLAHFTEEHTNLRRQRPAELIEVLSTNLINQRIHRNNWLHIRSVRCMGSVRGRWP